MYNWIYYIIFLKKINENFFYELMAIIVHLFGDFPKLFLKRLYSFLCVIIVVSLS